MKPKKKLEVTTTVVDDPVSVVFRSLDLIRRGRVKIVGSLELGHG